MTTHAAPILDVALFGAIPRYGDLCMNAVIDLRRSFDRSAIERAVERTVEAFPVLGSRYAPRFWRDQWVRLDTPAAEAVHVEDERDLEGQTDTWVRRPFDLTRERPLRVLGIQRARGMRLILSLMHVAVDGAGVAAVGHVFGAHLYGVDPAVPTEQRRDLRRALGGLGWLHVPVLARGMVSAALRPLRQAFAGRRTEAYPSAPSAPAAWRTLVFPREQMDAIRARCGGATVNDVLVGAFARVSARRSKDSKVVVSYTMDLRRYGREPRLIAANTSSVLSAILPRADLGTLERAVASASAATKRDRARLFGPALLVGPTLLGAILPTAVTRSLIPVIGAAAVDVPLDRGMALTNVGRVDDGLRAFGEDIEGLRIVGPRIAGVPVPLVVAFGFRGALHLEMYAAPGVGAEALEVLEREIREAMT
ncbi:MAG: hypothetical protein U0414_23560 [Polyangiaceae bacterium]